MITGSLFSFYYDYCRYIVSPTNTATVYLFRKICLWSKQKHCDFLRCEESFIIHSVSISRTTDLISRNLHDRNIVTAEAMLLIRNRTDRQMMEWETWGNPHTVHLPQSLLRSLSVDLHQTCLMGFSWRCITHHKHHTVLSFVLMSCQCLSICDKNACRNVWKTIFHWQNACFIFKMYLSIFTFTQVHFSSICTLWECS